MASQPTSQPRFLREEALAELLGVSVKTLRNWRHCGKGPRFRKLGGVAVRYVNSDVERWIAEQPVGGGRS